MCMATEIALHRAAWREEHSRAGPLRAMAAFHRDRVTTLATASPSAAVSRSRNVLLYRIE